MINYKLIILVFIIFISSCTKPQAILSFNLNNIKNKGNREFTITNKGDSTLIIKNVSTSCDCTRIELESSQEIKPNDSLKVKVTLASDSIVAFQNKVVFVTMNTNSKSQINSFSFKY